MIGRVLALWLFVVIATAIFAHQARAHDLPCLPRQAANTFQPFENLRGYGTTQEGLVKLSVSSSGAWMLTFSPPSMDGAVCIVWLGDNWEFVTGAGKKAKWTEQ
jgi:hypothetical protein